jgi:hypothetical protein
MGFCAECTTEFEGINYCHTCLARVRGKTQVDAGRLLPFVTLGLTLGLGWLLTRVIAWAAVFASLF